jgi:hypothetical protein
MFCAISNDQINDFRARVYARLYKMAEKKQPLTDVKSFIEGIHKRLIEASKDEKGNPDVVWATTHVAFIPSAILDGYGDPELMDILPDSTKELKELAKTFTDSIGGYDTITKYLAPKVLTPQTVNSLINADTFVPEEKEDDMDKLIELRTSLYFFETAAPSSPLSTTGQQSSRDAQGNYTNIADPEQEFYYGVRNKILKALKRSGDLTGATLEFGGHTGFKLVVMRSNKLPGVAQNDFSQLRPSDADMLKRGGTIFKTKGPETVSAKEYREDYFDKGSTMVITDNDGNVLYFDAEGNVVSEEEGRMIYIPLRQVNENRDGSLWTPNLATVNEIVKKKAFEVAIQSKKYVKQNKGETDAAYVRRLTKEYNLEEYAAEVKRLQQEELATIKKLREHLNNNPDDSVVVDITGGSLGYYRTDRTKLSEFTLKPGDVIRPAKENTVTQIKGRPYLTMDSIDTPIELRGTKIADTDSDRLTNIAQVLSRELYINGIKQKNQEKVDYILQFINPTKANGIFLRYSPTDDKINLTIDGERIEFPDTSKMTDQERVEVEKALESKITNLLNNVKNNLYLSINDSLLGGKISLLSVNGNTATDNTQSYIDFLKPRVDAFAQPARDGRVYALNGYYNFDIPQDQLDKIEGKTPEEKKIEETKVIDIVTNAINNTPTNNLPKDDDDLGELTRSRLLRAGATTEEIVAAVRWWNNSPLKGLIPLTQMVNIANSDAWATFTKSGITLFEGSDFTDVYHEAWHAFSQMFLTKEQKDKLYKEVKDSGITITLPNGEKVKSIDATPRQVEEYLAEEFRSFAMKGGVVAKTKMPATRKNLFQKIWDFLTKWLGGGITPVEGATNQAYIQPVQELFEKLYFAGKDPESSKAFKNHYMPHADITKYYDNMMFGYLASSPQALEEDATEKISYDEGVWVTSKIDSLLSMWVDAQNLKRQDRLATARLFSNINNQKSAYNWAKKQIENKVIELSNKYNALSEEEKQDYDNQILANDIRVLNWAVTNWGDTTSVLTGKQEKGMLAYQRERSRFKDVIGKVDPASVKELNNESTEVATSNEESISKGLRVGDRTGSELSIKEMANNSTLYLVRSLHKVDLATGKPMLDRIGFPELVDFSEAWNALVRNLAGSATPMDIYRKMGTLDLLTKKEELKSERNAKLEKATTEEQVKAIREEYAPKIQVIDRQLIAKTSFPAFVQLADKLGPPTPAIGKQSGAEFDMWTEFWQDMCKPRVPLVQMTNNRFDKIDPETDELTETEYTYSIGRTASDLNRIQFDWTSDFKKQSPSTNKFVKQNNNRENMLDLQQVIKSFGVRTKSGNELTLDPNQKIEFLRAIGIYLDDKPEIRNIVDTDTTLEITRLFKAVEHLYHMGREVYNPLKVLKDGFLYDYTVTVGGREVRMRGKEPSQTRRLEKLAAIQSKLSDSYSNLSVSTAENKKAYEHSLNNTLTVLIEGINRAKNFKDVYDENGETPWLAYLNPEYNPGILSSNWLNSIFTLDVPKTDPRFGQKRKLTTQETSEEASLILENISGVQMTMSGLYFEKGISSASSDRATKFISDFHMLLDSGIVELMRHASKTASFGTRVKSVVTGKNRKEKHLYVDTITFLAPPSGPVSIANNREVTDIVLKYLQSEVLRSGIVRNNPDVYKNIPGYKNGTSLTIFDDIIKNEQKSEVLSDKFYNELRANGDDILSLLSKPEYANLRYNLVQQIGSYFDKLAIETNDEMIKAEFISPQLMRTVISRSVTDPDMIEELMQDENYKGRMRNAMIKSYTVNQWIHNVESTFIVYGDLVQYNHDKDEFNKRNAGVASTGYLFRTDKAAQDFINEVWGRPYLQKYAEKNPNQVSLDTLNRKYDGTANTAILEEPVFKSYNYDNYDADFRQYYEELFKPKIKDKTYTKAQAKKMIDEIMYGKDGTKEEPTGGVMEPYFKMKVADGQGYVGFDFYRIMRKLEGKWLDSHEAAYQRIINGETLSPDELSSFFPPYKVQYFGKLKTKTLPVDAFHKFSLMPLIPGALKGNLDKLHNKMMEQGIDYVTFESGSKLNNILKDGKGDKIYTDMEGKVFNEEVEFTKNTIFMNYLKNQVDINMEFKGSVIFSTQLRKLAIQGLYQNGKPITKDAAAKAKVYEDLVDQLTDLKRKEFLKEAGWTEDKDGNLYGSSADLVALVQEELRRLGMSDHEIKFIDIDQETGEPKYDWSGHLSRERLERLVVAIVNNRLIKQKMYGEPLVQVSNALLEGGGFRKPTEQELEKYGYDTLPTYERGKNGLTTSMKVKIAMQGDFMNLFKLKDKEGKTVGIYDKVELAEGGFEYKLNMRKSLDNLNTLIRDDEWLDMNDNRKKITMVGVRIPVQGLNSMEFMEVYEFLDPAAGNIIVPPYEIVAKSGADFDIDKLNVFMPRLTSQGDFLATKYSSPEEIQKEIDKLKDEKEKYLKSIDANLSPKDIEKKLKGDIKEQRAGLRALGSQIALAKEERKQLMKNMRKELAIVSNSRRLDDDAREVIAKGSDEELMDLIKELKKSKQLSKISRAVDSMTQESWELYNKLKGIRDQYKLTEEELEEIQVGSDKVQDFKRKIASLNEQKRNFVATFENQMITSIRDILELPENFITLIRPNGTDLVKGISDELKPFVQENNPRISKLDGTTRKKGISPTRVLEPIFILDKHQDNNVGKKSLGIAAQVNTANTISTAIGGYLPSTLSFTETTYETNPETGKKEKVTGDVEMPVTFYLDHNTMMKDGKKVVSLSNIYDAQGITRISDIISQLMNGFVDIEKDNWVAYVQGNQEVTPVLTIMVEAGVPFKQAAYFVSNPLVREYVRQQRLAKSTYAGPLGTEPEDPTWFRSQALKKVLEENGLGKVPRGINLYKLVGENMQEIAPDGVIPMDTLSRIVATDNNTVEVKGVKTKGLPITSKETYTAFMHYIQIENFTSGIKNLRFKTNVDTKKDATLFDAKLREVEIDELYSNQGVPTELIDAYQKESIVSSFFIQSFQQKLWGRFFGTTNNEAVQEFLVKKLRNRKTRDAAKEITGWDVSKLASEFKNDFMLFLFQNYVKSFDLRRSDFYKGAKMEEKVPVKYVDFLKSGVVVKEENGKPKIFIDPVQVDKDWQSKAFEGQSYLDQGLAQLPAGVFTFKGNDSKKEYTNFVIEREYLRYMLPMDKAKEDAVYKRIAESTRLSLKRDENESLENFNQRVVEKAYEEYLRDKALDNTQNFYKLFYHKTESMGQQVMDVIKKYPHLEKQYPMLKQFAIRVAGRGQIGLENLTNILLKDQRDIDSDLANSYNITLRKMADPTVMKVKDTAENDRISSLFRALPIFAFLQTGMSKGEFSFTNVVPFEDYMNIMQEPMRAMKEFLKPTSYPIDSKELDKLMDESNNNLKVNGFSLYSFNKSADGKTVDVYNTGVLDRFWSAFLNQNSKQNASMRSRLKMYLYNATPKALLDGSNLDNTTVNSPFVIKTNRPGSFKLSGEIYQNISVEDADGNVVTRKTRTPLDTETVVKLANANTDTIFVFDDMYKRANAQEKGLNADATLLKNKRAKTDPTIEFSRFANGAGIRTMNDVNQPFNPTTDEGLAKAKEVIKSDIDALVQKTQGKKVVFPENGIGQDLLIGVENIEYKKELFRYLSEELYNNFGYVNPGSQNIPSIMDIIAREQGVTDQDKEDLKNRCLIL